MSTELFDAYKPIPSGQTFQINLSQTLGEISTGSGQSISFIIDGPQFSLDPADIAGVYPTPGSDDSPDTFLPHIALRRATVPWERMGPNGQPGWMALLLIDNRDLAPAKAGGAAIGEHEVGSLPKASAAALRALGRSDKDKVRCLDIEFAPLKKILPSKDEIALLAHVKQDGSAKTAIVIGNRLPRRPPPPPNFLHPVPQPNLGRPATLKWTAVLVSLEGRQDLYADVAPSVPPARAAVVVLHEWTFTPTGDGDFEEVIKKIRIRPNNGVMRFGNVATTTGVESLLDKSGYFRQRPPGEPLFRGPLRPGPQDEADDGIAVRAAPEEFGEGDQSGEDYSHALAFELGRLLALSDAGVLADLMQVRPRFLQPKPEKYIVPLPAALQKRDWVINPGVDSFWDSDVTPLRAEKSLLTKGRIDITGLNALASLVDMPNLAQLRTQTLANLKSIAAGPEAQIDEIPSGANQEIFEQIFSAKMKG